jgi:Icc-related predicted phosphoesterase
MSDAAVTPAAAPTVRLAAVGDLHLTASRAGRFRPALQRLVHHADVLLLAGDLTEHGTAEQGDCLAAEVRDLGLPVLAVLGNHDHRTGRTAAAGLAARLADAGVTVLDDTATVLTIDGLRLGVAGTMGFGGGFHSDPADRRADQFSSALAGLDADLRIALTHYAPVLDTLQGEPAGLYQVLGSNTLAAAIDAAGVHLAVHGHAHHGREQGTTAGGVAVRNVAYPVIRSEARIYHLQPQIDHTVQIATVGRDRVGAFMRWGSHRSVDLASRAVQHPYIAVVRGTRDRRSSRRG